MTCLSGGKVYGSMHVHKANLCIVLDTQVGRADLYDKKHLSES